MKIDAHQHFWRYTDSEFSWIDDARIRRDFEPSALLPLILDAGVQATIAVQARQSLSETEWLLDLAQRHSWIAGVVGWVPLTHPEVNRQLDRFSTNPKFKGVRHVLQAESDAFLDREDFNTGIKLLRSYHLVYDLLILERQLPAAIRFVDRHPNQPIVLDHLAKPLMAAQEIEPWRTNIRELARRPHVNCKLSGMVTEANLTAWTINDLQPYVDVVLEAFGPGRLLFGSDWPVQTVASSYSNWFAVAQELVASLSQDEQQQIFGSNAARLYTIENPSQTDR